MDFFDQHIKFIPGVGEKRAVVLEEELGITTVEEMLYHVPYRYVDRSKIYKIGELTSDLPYVQIVAKISEMKSVGMGKGMRMTAVAKDDTGVLELVWFKGLKYLKGQYEPDKEYLIFGQPSLFNHRLNVVHPEIELFDKAKLQHVGLQAMYPTTEKMKKLYFNSKAISKIQQTILSRISVIPETLPAWLLRKYNLMFLDASFRNIHFPESMEKMLLAQRRLKFEELFYIQLNTQRMKFRRKNFQQGFRFAKVGDYFNGFYNNCLPFPLTGAQKRVIKEIRQDCGSGKQMNRLLQGDVGSGKTLVALMCMLLALDNGYQACIMAPTEILATQHYESISAMVAPLGIKVALLTGSVKKQARVPLLAGLADGSLQLLIGTHALLEDNVEFANVGLVIVDEQHRFGVAQRAKLWRKNNIPPHVLVMTATPIPRTLAMTLYGDLDVSVIDELPPGRKPITTFHTFESRRAKAYQFIEDELKKGRQAYIVYPLITESEKMDFRNLEDGYEEVTRYFMPKGYKISMVHGKMKNADKDEEMRLFASGESQILVATTVIEVGVNVPNASVMLIESSERFGLSQLHQLRGRVGRGADQSYCILMSAYKLSNETRKRLEIMTSTNDGFEIAEADLKLRGPGDIEGTMQSGLDCGLKVASLGKDGLLLNEAAAAAADVLTVDVELQRDENAVLAQQLKRIFKTKINWHLIS